MIIPVKFTNEELLTAVTEARSLGYLTDELNGLLMSLVYRMAYRPSYKFPIDPRWISKATADVRRCALHFDRTKSENAFAYYYTVVYNSFLGSKVREQRLHRALRGFYERPEPARISEVRFEGAHSLLRSLRETALK